MEAKRSEWGFHLVNAVLLAAHGLVRKDPDVSEERVLGGPVGGAALGVGLWERDLGRLRGG